VTGPDRVEPASGGAAGVPAAGALPDAAHRAGFVALVGLPNVGKSTLLNAVLGRKLAIVTPKPQTTRTRILGIATRPGAQLLFVDTPGLHRPRNLLGERMVRAAEQSLADADVALWVVDAGAGLRPEEEELAARLGAGAKPVLVALNQIDRVKSHALLPIAERLSRLLPGRHVVPVSARTGENLEELLRTVERELPESPPLYPADAETDLPEKFFAAEIVREQVLLATEQEVPYQSAVTIESFTERPDKNLLVIAAQIRVARSSQKPIVIGAKGARIREIGQRARAELEAFFGVRVYLELFVKVDSRWFERAASLAELGL
jgi:GTP-binding protein Era